MNNDRLTIDNAIACLKSGYHLINMNTKDYVFMDDKSIVHVISEVKSLTINIYSFKELFKDSFFIIDDEALEEVVDPNKDKEYYSWRQ